MGVDSSLQAAGGSGHVYSQDMDRRLPLRSQGEVGQVPSKLLRHLVFAELMLVLVVHQYDDPPSSMLCIGWCSCGGGGGERLLWCSR